MIAAQNTEVRELSFEIKQLKHPGDKQLYIAFVNTVSGCAQGTRLRGGSGGS